MCREECSARGRKEESVAIFGFHTRTPQRDHETDRERIDRLVALIRTLRQEAADEQSGLRNRYEQAQTAAAFTLDAIENGEGRDLAAQADSLEETMRNYRRRIATLEKQLAFMGDLETNVTNFGDELAPSPTKAD